MPTTCPVSPKTVNGDCEEVLTTLPELPDGIDKPKIPSVSDVTTEDIDGTGAFDIYMRAGMNQLMTQYEEGRIKGADFAAAYVAMVELMMTEANKFVLGLVQAEIAAALFPMQYMSVAHEASLKDAQVRKTKHESDLICQQMAELKVNGASKRSLEDAQTKVACQQIILYEAQAKGFADKNRNDTFKTVMNSWAIDAVEVNPSPNSPGPLLGPAIGTTLSSAKAQAGIA